MRPPEAASISVSTSVSLVAVRPKPRPSSSSRRLGGVDDVAVVGDGERAVHRLDEERLDVAHRVGAGRAVAGVADRVVAGERRHRLRREHVGDEAGVLVQACPGAVADGDPGRLLPAVLQREQPEERDLRDALAVRRRHGEHAALVVRLVVVVRPVVVVARRRRARGRVGHATPSSAALDPGVRGLLARLERARR